jgi:hypothetical protein
MRWKLLRARTLHKSCKERGQGIQNGRAVSRSIEMVLDMLEEQKKQQNKQKNIAEVHERGQLLLNWADER